MGLAIEGTYFSSWPKTSSTTLRALSGNPPYTSTGRSLFFGDARFESEKGGQLGIAVLLDDEIEFVLIEECLNAFCKREPADAHEIGIDALRGENSERLANGEIAAAHGDYAEARIFNGFDSLAQARSRRQRCASAPSGPSLPDTR